MRDAYVKLFVEEREMTVMLLVDASGSGLFGSREQAKREVAAEVAALLAFSAIKNNDRVGLIIFTDRVEKFVPPKKGKKHVLRVITEILTHRRTALLHPAGSINKIVDHIEELHASPRLAARLARAARHLAVKKYTWDRNAARVLAMIATLHRQIREGRYAPAEEPAL